MYSFWSSKSSLLYRVTASLDDEPGLPTYSIHMYILMHNNIMGMHYEYVEMVLQIYSKIKALVWDLAKKLTLDVH